MSRQPNIIVIIVDQMRADMPGCYGNAFCATPNIDRIARRGVRCSRAYCTFPQCSPSRASLMTGLLPNKTGIGIQSDYRMFGERTVERLDPGIPSIGAAFHDAGYVTGYVGKWHLSMSEPSELNVYGFDFYAADSPVLENLAPIPGASAARYPAVAGAGERTPSWEGSQACMAADFIRRHAGAEQPFLLFYSDPRPHPPYFVTNEELHAWAPPDIPLWANLHDDLKGKPLTHRRLRENIVGADPPDDAFWKEVIRHYAALISVTDRDIGLVLQAIEQNHIVDDTIIVFLADHGDTCGAHGFLSKGVVAYEELIRVPLIVSWPGRLACNATCDRLVSLMDVFPTLAEAAGIAIPSDLDGRSLTPVLRGGAAPDWRSHLVVCHHGNMYGLCTMRAVVGDRYKYVYYPYDTAELYDCRIDPYELHNRIDDPHLAGAAAEMHAMLVRHTQACGDLVAIV